MINAALALIGPIDQLIAEVETVHKTRPGGTVTNDDHGQMMCRFANGAMGQMYFSRIATGRKMGYAYEMTGTKGAIRFDQEDQNAIWLYTMHGPEAHARFPQNSDRSCASRLLTLLPRPRPWHGLSRSDHHRSQGFPARHRNQNHRLANLPRRHGGQPSRRCGPCVVIAQRLGSTSSLTTSERHHMTIRIGNAPCSWGIEFAADPSYPTWQSVLRAMRRRGLQRDRTWPHRLHARRPCNLARRAWQNVILRSSAASFSARSTIRRNGTT